MTYIIFVISISLFSVFLQKESRNYEILPMSIFISFMILSFSYSDNFDHRNYIYYLDNDIYNLLEPMFVVFMLAYSYSGLDSTFFLMTTFIILALICFIKGDRLFLSTCLIYLSPVGVVSLRYFMAAMLISIPLKYKSKAFLLLPILTHYSTILPSLYFFIKIRYLAVSCLILAIIFILDKSIFFQNVSFVLNIDYTTRYGDIGTNNDGILNSFFKYTALLIVLLLYYFLYKKNNLNVDILGLLFISNFLIFSFSDIEVVSRICSIINLVSLYLVFIGKDDYPKYIAIIYLIGHGIAFSIFGLSKNIEIYYQSETIWNGQVL